MELQILMIDDHPSIIEGYKAMLAEQHTYQIIATEVNNSRSAYESIVSNVDLYDVILLDISLPAYPENKISSGADLIKIARKHQPKSKIIVITSHSDSLTLYKIVNESGPDGMMVKTDFYAKEFLEAFEQVLDGEYYYSKTILDHMKSWEAKNKVLDTYNRQILLYLAQGVKTKNLVNLLHLSKSAIDKRKALIKDILGIDKGTDEDILREARKRGLL